ncbi:MAG: plasmid pRiA4b ORF-3 family protein [bacterium]
MNNPKIHSLSSENKQILRNQVIDENGPGTVLRDFEILLGFIGSKRCQVSSKNNLLPMDLLSQLNAQLTHPIEIGLDRPLQKSYPYINGLYLLLRTTRLAYIEVAKTEQVLVLNEPVLQEWQKLNSTERYFTLLETWLLKVNPEVLGEHSTSFDIPIFKWLSFFKEIPAQGLKLVGNKDKEEFISYIIGLYTVALLELFGCISVQHGKPEKGKGWRIAMVHRTPFGDALLQLLGNVLNHPKYFYKESEMDVCFGELQPIIQPFFPQWRKNLSLPKPEFQDGIYIFKVSLRNVWRLIAIPGENDLQSLSNIILKTFNFDFDHLYCFTYRNRFGVSINVNHPYMEEEPLLADEVIIGDLDIKPGTTMTYLYDFGDNWKFDVKLERIDPVDPKIKSPIILESHGSPPQQYPIWDE